MGEEREYGDGEASHILEWLGREHGANAVELLCSELTDESDSVIRREGAVLGLGHALTLIIGMVRGYAERDASPGLRAACEEVLENLMDAASEPIGDRCPHTKLPCVEHCTREPGGCMYGTPYPQREGLDHG